MNNYQKKKKKKKENKKGNIYSINQCFEHFYELVGQLFFATNLTAGKKKMTRAKEKPLLQPKDGVSRRMIRKKQSGVSILKLPLVIEDAPLGYFACVKHG